MSTGELIIIVFVSLFAVFAWGFVVGAVHVTNLYDKPIERLRAFDYLLISIVSAIRGRR